MNQPTPPRPAIASEVRAWIGVGIVVMVHTVGMTWWAATLSAEVRALRDVLVRYQEIYSDHEERIRTLERKP